MNNLDAIKAKVGYPVSDNSVELALTTRGLTTSDEFSATSQAFDLAYADVIMTIVTSPTSMSEGGFSISSADRQTLINIANNIYRRYEVANPLEAMRPKARFVQRW